MLIARSSRTLAAIGQASIPVAVRGLNLRSGINALKPDEALRLDNWFPMGGYCRVRGGYTQHATNLGGAVGTLMEWAGPSSRVFFAATPTEIYDVSSSGAVSSASLTGLTSAAWQHVNFTTSGGNFLVCCNGSDDVRNFNGSAWTTPSITGVTSASLINVASYKTRLWFVEKDSTKAWYLGTSAISGSATSLELGDKFRMGGKLRLIGTISSDSGSGPADLICFISSKGEIVVYKGSDPADTSNWALVGVYSTSAPVGNRALVRIDGDLGMLTERGVMSVRQVAQIGKTQAESSAITGKIDQGIIDDFATYGSNSGWEMVVHGRGRQMIVNVPTGTNMATQYAMNIQTGSWSTYGRYASPLNATTWGIYNENLYFSTGATVYRAENGYDDNGDAIVATYKSSYQSLGRRGALERVTMVRPMFTASGRVTPAIRVSVDYQNNNPVTADEYPGTSGASGSLWGTGVWGTAVWGGDDLPYADWVSAQGIGTTSAVQMVTRTDGIACRLNAIDVKFEASRGVAL